MKKEKEIHLRPSGGIYRNINVSVKLLDAVIIGGLSLIAFIIIASVSLG